MSPIDLEKCDTLQDDSLPKLEPQSTPTYVAEDNASLSRSRSSTISPIDDGPLDSGFRAWATVMGSFLALLCTFGQLTSFGTFQSWYAEHQLQHMSPSTISWIGSLQLWVFFFSVSSGVTCNSNHLTHSPHFRLGRVYWPHVRRIRATRPHDSGIFHPGCQHDDYQYM